MYTISFETSSKSYHDVLERLEQLDAHLVILDSPRIALSKMARLLILDLEGVLTETFLSTHDLELMDHYLSAALEFCNSYFKPADLEQDNSIELLRLPCDSRDLLRAHRELHQRYLIVRASLWDSMKNAQPEQQR